MTPEEMAVLPPPVSQRPGPGRRRKSRDTLASPYCFVLTEPQGFLIGRAVAGEAELITLAVDPAARQRGTRRAASGRISGQARTRGAESAFLEVSAANLPAQSLYARKGFDQKANAGVTTRRPIRPALMLWSWFAQFRYQLQTNY